jgi:hypothetical protein
LAGNLKFGQFLLKKLCSSTIVVNNWGNFPNINAKEGKNLKIVR